MSESSPKTVLFPPEGWGEWREAVATYHDGEAGAAEHAAVEELLAHSAEARAYLAELRILDAAVNCLASSLPAPSTRLQERYPALVQADSKRPTPYVRQTARSVSWRWFPGTAVAAAAALLLVVGLLWWLPDGPSVGDGSSRAAGHVEKLDLAPRSGLNGDGADGGLPDLELLELLELLASDLDFDVLAALEPQDVEIVADVVYYHALATYDNDDEFLDY